MFTIVHYAGAVTYEIDGFPDKNNDLLHNDIAGCLRSSSESFVRLLFAEGGGGFRRHSSVVQGLIAGGAARATSCRRGAQRRQKGDLTLSSKFKKQLARRSSGLHQKCRRRYIDVHDRALRGRSDLRN